MNVVECGDSIFQSFLGEMACHKLGESELSSSICRHRSVLSFVMENVRLLLYVPGSNT